MQKMHRHQYEELQELHQYILKLFSGISQGEQNQKTFFSRYYEIHRSQEH
jgi:hypothetical protein